jgi:SAM-dependent methyltransferase
MNFRYVVARLVRHFMPEWMVRYLLLHSVILKAGLETADPEAAVRRYAEALQRRGLSLDGKTVLVFGYGGRFDVGIGLLEHGANHVVLCDRYAHADNSHNRGLVSRFRDYFDLSEGDVRPRPDRITLFQGDIVGAASRRTLPACDLVISNSVLEHVDDLAAVLTALGWLTKPSGLHIHYIDLRDHYFKYPFEMLRYDKTVWTRWLNPSSNLNRLRVWQYQDAFDNVFEEVEIEILQKEESAFALAEPHVRPEFKTGSAMQDAVTLIKVISARPIRQKTF